MDKQTALKITAALSGIGVLFAGYLSYSELLPKAPGAGIVCAAASAKILGIPTCIYGLATFLAIFIVSMLALRSSQ